MAKTAAELAAEKDAADLQAQEDALQAAADAAATAVGRLTWGRTWSVPAFKSKHNISSIDVVRNPNSGKLFFVSKDDGDIRGAVSAAYTADPCISEVCGEDGEMFFLLHKRGEGNGGSNVVETL
jgi:hypothetical protein